MSHLLRVLLAVSVLAAPGAALAQCTKDTDCKGERVCEAGVCVSPSERRAPPPPPPMVVEPPPSAPPPPRRAPPPPPAPAYHSSWEQNPKKNILAVNVLSTLGGLFYGIANPGSNVLQTAVLYERSIFPHVSLFGTVTPSLVADPVLGTGILVGLMAGGRYYFFDEMPTGLWLGGEVGLLPLANGVGIIFEAGWQWVLDSGWVFGLSGGPVTNGFSIGVTIGGFVGWNF